MPVDVSIVVVAASAALLIGGSIVYQRSRRRSKAVTQPPSAEPPPVDAARVSPGEREAAWSARTAAGLLSRTRAEVDALRVRVDAADRSALLLEAESDDVRGALATADTEIAALRSEINSAEEQIARLETEIAATTRAPGDEPPVEGLEDALAEMRGAVARHAAAERDLRYRLEVAERAASVPDRQNAMQAELAAAALRIGELETALAADPAPGAHEGEEPARRLQQQIADLTLRLELEERSRQTLRSELATARSEAEVMRRSIEDTRQDADRRIAAAAAEVTRQAAKAVEFERAARETDRDAARLVVRDAEIADLEARLAALSSARESELRRLNDKIGSMERLYIEVEGRERRIVQLEDEVKAVAEARDDAVSALAQAERDLVTVQGAHGEALAALERLQSIESDLTEARTRIVELETHEESAALRGELERLQRTLATERERSARMQRRVALDDQPKIETTARTYAEWDRLLRERVAAAVEAATAPLRERVARLRVVVEEKEQLISTFTNPPVRTGPDDLTLIRGIGPKIRDILHGMGITEFRRIAQFTDQDVEVVGAALPVYGGRILDDRWIEQARELAG